MTSPQTRDLLELARSFRPRVQRLREEIGRVVVGQDRVVEEVLVALLAGGHVLLEGVPGLAKTLLVNTLGSTLSLDSGRIQFTPDLMPSDVVGSQVMVREETIGSGPAAVETDAYASFRFQPGPVFVHLLLADEINRTPPKTQAALLEAMAEGRVTAGGRSHELPTPFFVLATQNPIEQEGTYNLPEAQLDRFLFKVVMGYPGFAEEERIVRQTTGTSNPRVAPVWSREEILGLQRVVRALQVSSHIAEYAARLVRRSRPGEPEAPDWVRRHVEWGAGPRATQSLLLAAKARTLLDGRFAVTRRDVRDVALPVLRHRVLPTYPAEAEGLTVDDLVCRLVLETPPFAERVDYDEGTQKILRF